LELALIGWAMSFSPSLGVGETIMAYGAYMTKNASIALKPVLAIGALDTLGLRLSGWFGYFFQNYFR